MFVGVVHHRVITLPTKYLFNAHIYKGVYNSRALRYTLERSFSCDMQKASSNNSEKHQDKKRRMENLEVVLTEEETRIFDALVDVVKTSGCGSVLRAAGGWVRDKLRGELVVGDVDIAIDNMFGKDFAEKVNEYLTNHGDKTHKIGVIRSNPDQSKHLETATMHIFDRWLDFVNLRSESYSEDSRIPSKMDIGTPLEDALRRDLTINSLFYNINERKVEDFTNKGIEDLKRGIIRTPLHPLTTFLDDPLRVLRAVRFAARFTYEVDVELFNAASDSKVKVALRDKISKERIGKELDGMLNGARPDMAFNLISQLGLYDIVFALPTGIAVRDNHEAVSRDNVRQIVRLLSNVKPEDPLYFDREYRRISILASAMGPYREYTYLNNKKKETPITSFIIGESVKLSTKDCTEIYTILKHSDPMKLFVHSDLKTLSRKDVGLLLKEVGKLWKVSLAVALISELKPFNKPLPTHVASRSDADTDDEESIPSSELPLISKYNAFVKWIEDKGLIGVWDLKPILDGRQVQTLLKRPQGPWLGEVMRKVMEWQLDHPQATKEESEQWLLQQSGSM